MTEPKPLLFLLDRSDEYRDRKVAFVTGFDGCSMTEVVASLAPITAGLLLNRVALSYLSLAAVPGAKMPLTARFALEFLVIVMPCLLGFTLLADYSIQIAMSQLALAGVLHCLALALYRVPLLSLSLRPDHALHTLAAESRKSFVSNLRSCMMISTWVAILAVDFAVFPRRFAKTEMFGTSVMDMGVGAFIFSSAIVSRQTRRLRQMGSIGGIEEPKQVEVVDGSKRKVKGSGNTNLRNSSTMVASSFDRYSRGIPTYMAVCKDMTNSMLSTVLAVSPLILLGFGRLIVHSALNYQTHVTEYGVHWNFPFTAVAVAILASILEVARSMIVLLFEWCGNEPVNGSRNLTAGWYGSLGFVVAVLHQQFLRSPISSPHDFEKLSALSGNVTAVNTIQDYILYADRDHGFIAQNREGLASVCGFFAVYLFGVAAGRIVLDNQRSTAERWRSFAVKVGIICVSLWAIVDIAIKAHGPVSRRLVNFPYIVWIVAFAGTMLLSLLAIDLVTVIPNVGAVHEEVVAAPTTAKPVTKSWWNDLKQLVLRPEPFSPTCLSSGSIIMEATNVNFLGVFIISNLLVGLVNNTMRTLDISDAPATAILSIYMLANCAIAVSLKKAGIQLKVW